MDDIVIKVEGLGKRYRLGQRRPIYKRFFRESRYGNLERLNGEQEWIWALRNVSFEVGRGEVVGIIGRNGAGKSTLLKILSRITEPTEGRAEILGRVGSLLEVGTGFHPELTGRENIYLNGAILGMKKAEIDRKFDEIVGFSELERFIDTPVKRYSSGMYVRLAFAVAAHLEPEVLLVDEVLAVGDAAFQKRCLGKMGDVAREGRTILFVSHNMAAVAKLCNRAFLFNEGYLKKRGEREEVIAEYIQSTEVDNIAEPYSLDQPILLKHQLNEKCPVMIERIEFLDMARNPMKEIYTGDALVLRINFIARRKIIAPAFMVSLSNRYGVQLTRLSTIPISGYYIESINGKGAIELIIDEVPFTGGMYFLTLGVARANVEWLLQLENIAKIIVKPKDVYQSGLQLDDRLGYITLKHRWQLQPTGES